MSLAQNIDNYLTERGSPLAGLGRVFVREGAKHGVDPRFLVAIAGAETSFGTTGRATSIKNAWGWGPHRVFPSFEAGISTIAGALATSPAYAGGGNRTIATIGSRWAPIGASNDPTNLNSNWSRNVSTYYRALGGDPNAPVVGVNVPLSRDEMASSSVAPPSPSTGASAESILGPAPKFKDIAAQRVIERPDGQSIARAALEARREYEGAHTQWRERARQVAAMGGGTPNSSTGATSSTGTVANVSYGGGPVQRILPGDPAWGSYGYADPEGQGGRHLAVDWFAPNGTRANSPVTGTVVRITPNSGGTTGQVFGGTLAIRDTSGRLFVMRHIDPANLRVGQRINAGDHIGTPSRWSGPQHIHLEVYRPGSGDREYRPEYAINPRDVFSSGQ